MAIDATTLQPIRPFQGMGSSGMGLMQPHYAYLEDSEAPTPGDILVYNGTTGRALVDNVDPAVATILGVALDAHTAAATATDDDFVLYAPAMPGMIFEANIADDTGDADITGFAFATLGYTSYGLNSTNTGGTVVIDEGDTTAPQACVLGPARAQIRGAALDGAATVNPRCEFIFANSVFLTPPVS